MVEKQASSEIAGKSMNKSEIAEKAAREIHDRFVGGCVPEKCDVVIDISAIVERAIAESQQSEPDAYGYCEYSAIHRETAHFREPGCIKWRPL